MNASWLTWKCFLAGLKMLGIIGGAFTVLVGSIVLLVWLAEKGRPKLALSLGVAALGALVVVLGMLDCAGIIH